MLHGACDSTWGSGMTDTRATSETNPTTIFPYRSSVCDISVIFAIMATDKGLEDIHESKPTSQAVLLQILKDGS